jgi:GcrA cell cycle regulator
MNYAERNREIAARCKAGATLDDLAVDYDISRERVRQLVHREGVRPVRGMPSPWPPARDAELRILWSQDLSATEIGLRLDVSRNAVVGRAHRLDLPRRPSPIIRDDRPRLPASEQPAKRARRAAHAAALSSLRCAYCGVPLGKAQRLTARYCSHRCVNAAYYLRIRQVGCDGDR